MKKSLWSGAEGLGLPVVRPSQKSKVTKQEVLNQTIPKRHIPGVSPQGRMRPGRSCGALSSTSSFVPSWLNSTHLALRVSSCAHCLILSSHTVAGTRIVLWGLLTQRSWLFCNSYGRMTSCEHTYSTAAGTAPDSYHTLTGAASGCQCALQRHARPGLSSGF